MADENTKVVIEFLGDISDIESKLNTLKKSYENLNKALTASFNGKTKQNMTTNLSAMQKQADKVAEQQRKAREKAEQASANKSQSQSQSNTKDISININKELSDITRVSRRVTTLSKNLGNMSSSLTSLTNQVGSFSSELYRTFNNFQAYDNSDIMRSIRGTANDLYIVSTSITELSNTAGKLDTLVGQLALMQQYGLNLNKVYGSLADIFNSMSTNNENLSEKVPTPRITDVSQLYNQGQPSAKFDPNSFTGFDDSFIKVIESNAGSATVNVQKLDSSLEQVKEKLANMNWNIDNSLTADMEAYNSKIMQTFVNVDKLSDRISQFKERGGRWNNNFGDVYSSYLTNTAGIGEELKQMQALAKSLDDVVKKRKELESSYTMKATSLDRDITAQKFVLEKAKADGDKAGVAVAKAQLRALKKQADEIKKELDTLRNSPEFKTTVDAERSITKQYDKRAENVEKRLTAMKREEEVLRKGLENDGKVTESMMKGIDDTGASHFADTLQSISGSLKTISSLSGTMSGFTNAFSKWSTALTSVHPVLLVIATVLKLVSFLAGQIVQGFQRMVRIAKAVANAFVKVVKPAVTIAVKAVKSLVKSLVSFGTNTVKKTLSAPFKLIEKGIKSVESLLSMLRTRIKRRVVAEMFEDLTGTLASMSEQRDQFNESMSSMVMALRMFGSQIIAIAQPILEILAPAVEFVSNLLTGVADKLSQFTARLNGQDTYFKASEGVYDFATAMKEASGETESATKSAKAYENTVMGFDQLNKLNGTKDNSSGSSRKKNTASPVNMKKALTEANALNQLADKIRKAFKNKDFKNAGKYVAESVNDAFSWLDKVAGWEKNADKIKGFTKGVIDFINGFSKGIDPKVIGHAIGDVLNSGIEFVKMLTDPNEGVDFKLIGRNIGEILQNAILTIKWEDLGKAFVQTIQSFVRMAVGFLTTPGLFADIGTAFRESLSGAIEAFKPEDWSDMFAGVINALSDFMVNAFDEDVFSKAGEKLGDMLNETWKKIDTDKLSSGVAGFIRSLASFVMSVITTTDWGGILGGIVVTIADVLVKIFEDPTGEKDLYTSAEEKGKAFGSSLADGFNKFVETIKDRKDTIVDSIVAPIKAVMSAVGTFLTESDWGTLFATLINGFFEVMGKLFDSPEKARKFGEDLSAKVRDMFEQLDTDTITGGANNFFESIGAFLEGLFDENNVTKIREKLTEIGTRINVPQALLDALKLSNFGLITPFITNIGKDICSSLIDGIKTAWNDVGGFGGLLRSLLPAGDTDIGQFVYEGAGIGSIFDPLSHVSPGFSAGKLAFKLFSSAFGGKKANGGFVGDGQLFVANENGAEAIVRGDGGRTIVTNNQQMIMAITNGVRSAMSDAMRVMSGNNSNGNGGDIVLYVDSEELARASLRGQRSLDKRLNPVIQFA